MIRRTLRTPAGPRVRPPRRALRKAFTSTLTASLALVTACEGWEVWDNVFWRPERGWLNGDAASTVKIGSRYLWVFGDTVIHSDWNTTTREFDTVFGNTIALHDLQATPADPPAASAVSYYARTAAGAVTNISQTATPGFARFFDTTCPSGGLGNDLIWPGSGIYQSSNLGFFTFKARISADPALWTTLEQYVQRWQGVTSANPVSWTCISVNVIPRQYTSSTPTALQIAADPSLLWGGSVVKVSSDGNSTYIYGVRAAPNGSTPGSNLRLHLAKVETDTALFNSGQSSWKYYYGPTTPECPQSTPCWSTLSPNGTGNQDRRNRLFVVAENVGGEFSVHQVTSGAHSRWMLVTGGRVPLISGSGTPFLPGPSSPYRLAAFANLRQLDIRTSHVPTQFPGASHGSSIKDSSGWITGSTVRQDVIAYQVTDPEGGFSAGPLDAKLVTGYNAFRSIHAIKGHSEISSAGNLHLTYYVWDMKARGCTNPDDASTCAFQNHEEYDLYYSAIAAGATSAAMPPSEEHLPNSRSSVRSTRYPLKYSFPWCCDETPTKTCSPVVLGLWCQ